MKNLYGLTAAVFGTAATIVLIQPHAAFAALSATQVDAIARQVTVKIDGQNPGSGVIIAKQGQTYYVLTAEHVVRTPDEYYVITPDGKSYKIDYQRVKKLPGLDLAVVPFTSAQTYQVVAIGSSSQLKEGTVAYVAGFPMQGIDTTQTRYRFSLGEIAAQATRSLDNGYALAYFNNTFAGMSGGGILDQQGQLIGIHGASRTPFAENQGIIPELGSKFGLNLGIPIDTFLRSVPQVLPELKLPAASPLASVSAQMTASDSFIQGFNHLEKGDFKAALTSFDQAIRIQPNYAAAHYIRGGIIFLDNNDKQEAIANYNQVIRFSPNFALAYNGRGGARAELGDKQGAIADYDQAIRLDPNYDLAYNNRGNARYKSGDKRGALADYDQAIRLNPNNATAYNGRGVVRFDLGDKQGAFADYDQAIRLSPRYDSPYYNRGKARFALGDKQGAFADYDQAIRLNPNFANAYNGRGGARAELGDKQGAISDFDQAIRLNPNDAGTYFNRGLARSQLGDKQGAILDYDQAIRLNPSYASAYNNRGTARANLGDQQGAIADMQRTAELAQAQGDNELYETAIDNLRILQR
jgi:tetratricopeptide (TPR) repeat protein